MELTDQQLLTDWCTRKDAHAFQGIVQRHATMVFHTALRILHNPADAEDTTQQCFETLITTENTEHIQSLGAWLHGIATKISLKHIRTNSRRSQREKSYTEITQPQNDTQEWQEIYPLIDEAIRSLHEKYRTPVIAHFLEGQTHATIAKDLNVSRSTITNHINQGIQQIESSLKKKGLLTTLALAPTLATKLANAAPMNASLISTLGKLALTQGLGIATAASSFTIATTLKWVAVALLVSAGTTLGLWKIMSDSPQPLRAATLPVEASTPPLTSTPPASLPPANTQPTQNIVLVAAVQEPAPEPSITTTAVAKTDSDQPLTNIIHVSGIVTDTDGNPAPNATVNAIWLSGETDVVTDEEGRFTIPLHRNLFIEGELVFVRKVLYEEMLYDIPMRAEVHGDALIGYADTPIGQFPITGERTTEGEHAFGEWNVSTTFENEDHRGKFTLEQDPDGTVHGTWIDDLGPPELSSLVVSDKIRLTASLDDKIAYRHDFDVPITGRDDITLALSSLASVSGQVIDSEGTPLTDWYAVLRNSEYSHRIESDENGRFTIEDIVPGQYEFTAYRFEPHIQIKETETIALTNGQTVEGITLVYELQQTLTGYISDSDGRPIEGVDVTGFARIDDSIKSGHTAYTDASGYYRLSGIADISGTKVRLQVFHEEYMQEHRSEVLLESATQNFTLLKRPTLQGRVVDANTDAPINQYRIFAAPGGDSQNTSNLRHVSGHELTEHENGAFTTNAIGYGNISIFVSAPGYATTFHRLPYVQPGEARSGITIALEPVKPIKGKVHNANGDPIQGARVYLSHLEYVGEGITRTDRNGEFKIMGYPPTALGRITVRADGYLPSNMDISPPYRRTLKITLENEGLGNIQGTLTHDGIPVERGYSNVRIHVGEIFFEHSVTHNDGHHTFNGLPDQPLTLQANWSRWGKNITLSRTFTTQSGETNQQDFNFETGGTAYIKGAVLIDNEAPRMAIVFAATILPNGDEVQYRTEIGDDGTFTFGPIPSGTYQIVKPGWIQHRDGSYHQWPHDIITVQSNQTTRHDVNIKTE